MGACLGAVHIADLASTNNRLRVNSFVAFGIVMIIVSCCMLVLNLAV